MQSYIASAFRNSRMAVSFVSSFVSSSVSSCVDLCKPLCKPLCKHLCKNLFTDLMKSFNNLQTTIQTTLKGPIKRARDIKKINDSVRAEKGSKNTGFMSGFLFELRCCVDTARIVSKKVFENIKDRIYGIKLISSKNGKKIYEIPYYHRNKFYAKLIGDSMGPKSRVKIYTTTNFDTNLNTNSGTNSNKQDTGLEKYLGPDNNYHTFEELRITPGMLGYDNLSVEIETGINSKETYVFDRDQVMGFKKVF